MRRRIDSVLAGEFRKRYLAHTREVTDEAIANYYESHREAFREPEIVRVKAIRVKTEEEAENILKDLKEGAVFSSVAIQKSLYPNASRRAGDIGWLNKGQRDPALDKKAFSLDVGQVSDIIKTEAGYEIIKVMEKKGGDLQPLDEAKPLIKMELTKQQTYAEKQRYFKKAGVKMLEQGANPSAQSPASGQ